MALAVKRTKAFIDEDLDMEIEQTCQHFLEGKSTLSHLAMLQDIEASKLELKIDQLNFIKDEIISTVIEAYDIFTRFAKKT